MFIGNRRSLLAGLFLVATAAMSDGASAAKVSAILEGDLRASQLQALGTRWVVASKSAGQVAVYVPPSAGSTGATLIRMSSVAPEFPSVVSGNGRVLAAVKGGTGGASLNLSLIDVESGESIGAMPLADGALPDAVWVNAAGTAAGVFVRNTFSAFSFVDRAVVETPLFKREAAAMLASPSGRFVFLLTELGQLQVIDTETWAEVSKAQTSIQGTVLEWVRRNKVRAPSLPGEGPFVFPVAPIQISADDRLMAIYLGENANTFLSVCMATGAMMSTVVLDKRVDARFSYSQSGRLFAVQVTPNSGDPAFQRPRESYGYRIYDSYSGNQIRTLPIPQSDWNESERFGPSFFLDHWPGWIGFLPGDKNVLRIDTTSRVPIAQAINIERNSRRVQGRDPQEGCPALGLR